MKDRITKLIPLGMLVGVILGALLGYLVPEFMLAIAFLGKLFLSALKIIVIPLILTTIVVGISSLGDLRKVGRAGTRTLLYFLATTAVAVVVGLILVNIINPGTGTDVQMVQTTDTVGLDSRSVPDMLGALLPESIPGALAQERYLGLILFALFLGGVLSTLGVRGRTMTTFFREFNEALAQLVLILLYAAPLGLFSLAGSAVAGNSGSLPYLAQGLGWLALTLLIGLIIHGGLVLPAVLKYLGHRSPTRYLGNMGPALLTALGTSSSAATLPVTYDCVVGRNKVDSRAGSLVLPLGAVANLNGTAMYVVIAAVFLAQMFGIEIGLAKTIVIALTATLVSIGAAGVPLPASLVMATVLGVAGFEPDQVLSGALLIAAVDWLFDRCRAVVDVWGDSVGAAVVAETFEFQTARRKPRERSAPRAGRVRDRSTWDRSRSSSRAEGRPAQRGERRPPGGRQGERRTGHGSEAARPARPRGASPKSPRLKASPFEMNTTSLPALGVEETRARGAEAAPSVDSARERSEQGRPADAVPRADGAARRRRGGSEAQNGKPSSEGRLNPATVARELAKVSAQLTSPVKGRDGGHRHEGDLFDNSSPAARKATPKKVQEPAGEVEPASAAGTSVKPAAPSSDDTLPTDRHELGQQNARGPSFSSSVAGRGPKPREEPTDTTTEKSTLEFGSRSRRRHNEKSKADDSPKAGEPSDMPEVKSGFSAEDITFGRSKKKRTR